MRWRVDFEIKGTGGNHHAVGSYEDKTESVEVEANNRKGAIVEAKNCLWAKGMSADCITDIVCLDDLEKGQPEA